MKLSIVIPTLGRETLVDTLESCADADEIVVVLDKARGGTLPCELPDNAVLLEGVYGVTGGHLGRVHGIAIASGTHLAFFDDDDVYEPGSVDLMKAAACDVPVIFRMDDPLHGIIWREPVLRWANVSTQMLLVPNDPAKLGSWEPHMPGLPCPGGDYTFACETVANYGGRMVWREEIVAVIRPHERPGRAVPHLAPPSPSMPLPT